MKYGNVTLGQIEALINKLGGEEGVQRFLAGLSEVVQRNVIDCDADPFLAQGWMVEKHTKGGRFQWDVSKVELWLANGQKNDTLIQGNKLRKELAKKSNFNANVLDYLLANSHLIPEEWKGKKVFFWGTVYRDPLGNQCVRYLYWSGGRWRSHYNGPNCYWDDNNPAALRAS